MGAALMWAESESWLPSDQPEPAQWLARSLRTRAEAPKPLVVMVAAPSLDQHMRLAGCQNEGCLGPLRASKHSLFVRQPEQAKTKNSFLALSISIVLHGTLGLAATILIPKNPELAERGGAPAYLDVLMIGEEEAAALFEGAKPQPVSVVQEPLITQEIEPETSKLSAPEHPVSAAIVPTEPVVEPQAIIIPLPDWPIVPSIILPDLPTVPPVTQAEQTEPSAPQKRAPAIHRAKAPERKAAPAPVRPAKTRTEAHGKTGEGIAAVSRVASQRGGTGGRAPVAGTAALTSYRSRLVAHLTRYKNYPEQAQDRGIGGRNAVAITLSRDGRVLSAALVNASGHSILDSATLAAARRAQPFPAIPEGGPTTFTVTIGMHYDIR